MPLSPGRSARPRSGRDAHRRTRSPRSGLVEFAGEKHTRRLQDLSRSPQIAHLVAKSGELFALSGGESVTARAVVGLVLAHPQPQGFGVDPQVAGNRGDGTFALTGDPNTALSELGRVLRGSGHGSDSFLQDQ